MPWHDMDTDGGMSADSGLDPRDVAAYIERQEYEAHMARRAEEEEFEGHIESQTCPECGCPKSDWGGAVCSHELPF